ncbi:hypothetical protein C8Q73DRAFT_793918 [Cubamyces lactineus]|nr:hypothetical protein C8Q73DRAFT_793918 [Cubamyces lactineus]
MLKIVPATYFKHKCKGNITAVRTAIVQKFTTKSMLARLNLWHNFLNMRADPRQDLCSKLDSLQLAYENLLTYNVSITDGEYASTIISFLSDNLSAFISQLSAQMKLQSHPASTATTLDTLAKASQPAIGPNLMIELVLKEWERCCNEKKPKVSRSKDAGVAASTVSTEKPKWKDCGKGLQRPVGMCWNCSGKGHHEATCLSPKSDNSKGKGVSKGNNSKPATGTMNVTIASSTYIEEFQPSYAGAWSALPPDLLASVETDNSSASDVNTWLSAGCSAYTGLMELTATTSDSLPSLQTVLSSALSYADDNTTKFSSEPIPLPEHMWNTED